MRGGTMSEDSDKAAYNLLGRINPREAAMILDDRAQVARTVRVKTPAPPRSVDTQMRSLLASGKFDQAGTLLDEYLDRPKAKPVPKPTLADLVIRVYGSE